MERFVSTVFVNSNDGNKEKEFSVSLFGVFFLMCTTTTIMDKLHDIMPLSTTNVLLSVSGAMSGLSLVVRLRF
ncbi:unnamed protein product [Bursaphelenchus okinawaensis]|uniref:Uncharacterized protein n=1 Tax=Bursaphelenchus okinawaensis TaxID=465554 RepID=A0A811K0I2_9BILA|nr:unnamed protein product [Bursaphelenchus okinawaensis]CAG9089177.1 unnamed protein product [Bursaphelenchus okinawaensis]